MLQESSGRSIEHSIDTLDVYLGLTRSQKLGLGIIAIADKFVDVLHNSKEHVVDLLEQVSASIGPR